MHSGEYETQEGLGGLQKVRQNVHRLIRNTAPNLVLLTLSEDILCLQQHYYLLLIQHGVNINSWDIGLLKDWEFSPSLNTTQ